MLAWNSTSGGQQKVNRQLDGNFNSEILIFDREGEKTYIGRGQFSSVGMLIGTTN